MLLWGRGTNSPRGVHRRGRGRGRQGTDRGRRKRKRPKGSQKIPISCLMIWGEGSVGFGVDLLLLQGGRVDVGTHRSSAFREYKLVWTVSLRVVR